MDWYKRAKSSVHTHNLQEFLIDGIRFAARRAISRTLIPMLEFSDTNPVKEYDFGKEMNLTIKEGKGEFPEKYSKRVGDYQIDRLNVKEFQNVRLSGLYALGINDTRSIIFETAGGDLYQLWPTISSMIKYDGLQSTLNALLDNSNPVQEIQYAASLVSFFADNYYHWIVEHLPKLRGIEYYASKEGVDPVLIIPHDPPQWMKESLYAVGYDESDWIEWRGDCISVEHLIVPEHPFRPIEHRYSPRPENWKWLRERVISTSEDYEMEDVETSPYIYISREDADSRRVVNREELLNMLKSYGFKSYVLSELSFKQQAELFNQANIVISPHGAGASNIVFGDNLEFIELCHSGHVRGAFFFMLAQECGHSYASLLCEPSGVDMIVDTQKLSNILENGFVE